MLKLIFKSKAKLIEELHKRDVKLISMAITYKKELYRLQNKDIFEYYNIGYFITQDVMIVDAQVIMVTPPEPTDFWQRLTFSISDAYKIGIPTARFYCLDLKSKKHIYLTMDEINTLETQKAPM